MSSLTARFRRGVPPAESSDNVTHDRANPARTGPDAIFEAIRRAEKNINPLYENIDRRGIALRPDGGVDLSGIMLDGTILRDLETVLSDLGYKPAPGCQDRPLRVTVKMGRRLREELDDAHRAALQIGEWWEPDRLKAARDDITCAMKDYAVSIDRLLGEDFERAEAAWDELREDERILEPLLTSDGRLFSQRWGKKGPNERVALRHLEDVGLDRKGIDAWAAGNEPRQGTAHRVGRHPVTAFAVLAVIFVSTVAWKDPMAFVFTVTVFAFVGMFVVGVELARTEEMLDDLKTHAEAESEHRAESFNAQRYYIRKLSKRGLAATDSAPPPQG